MNKDEIQQTKALIKLKCIKRVIDILQDLNLLEDEKNMKQYNLILDYKKDEDFTTFMVKINAEGFDKHYIMLDKTLFNFNFKLKDENTGFAIFKNIREYFVKKNDLQYPSFQKNMDYPNGNLKYSMHHIKTNHHMDLFSIIHTKKDEEKLEKFSQTICNKYRKYIRNIHSVETDKDFTQLLKAEKKKELACTVINMLNELACTDYNQDRQYEILLDYQKLDGFYEFKTSILKNNATLPLNINFKLKNKEDGIKIFNEIVKNYIENYDISFGSYNNSANDKTNYVIVSRNNINLNYRIPSEYFNETMEELKNTINKKKNKILEKAK